MEQQPTVLNDFKQNWDAILVLMISFMPFMLGGYSAYLLILMLPVMWCRGFLVFTENAVICLAFGMVFSALTYINMEMSPSGIVMYALFPFIAYESGMYIFKRFKNIDSFSLLMAILIVCMSVFAVIMCVKDYFETGNIINFTRAIGINEDEWDPDAEAQGISATGLGTLVSLVLGTAGMLLVKSDSKIDGRIKIMLAVAAVLGLYVTIHVLNRAGFIYIVVGVIIAFFRPPVSSIKIGMGMMIIILAGLALFAVAQSSEVVQKAIEGYAERNNVVGYGMESMGGRTDRWAAALEQIPHTPLGAKELDFTDDGKYAHNMWLDCAINGGWLSLALLLTITFRFVMRFLKVFRLKKISNFNRSFYMLILATLILQCMVEPILLSVLPYFLLWIFFWAYINNVSYCDEFTNQ